jgi:heme/copper-type cytochrome/quinol oxidase subunit 2
MSMIGSSRTTTGMGGRIGAIAVPLLFASVLMAGLQAAKADDAISLSVTIKDRKFDPPEIHAPAGRAIEFHVKNLNDIVSEFESSDLHFEKIVPAGSEAVVHVRAQQPGKYNFYDDFHHETQGYLIVP